ncbi:hypothetical protein Goarm_021443 [Gossypium armourianum]|uniref:Uncharacterized protein n=1 Tax=Gossypium armourianum TaxID=34283 RepID=A0A7J9ISN8_9ROSI|nr:hypothetical protein [Gossypium armourianum]
MASLPPSNGQTEDKESLSKSALTQDNSSPLVVFAHGAGAPSSFGWMIRYVCEKESLHPRQKLTLEAEKCKCPTSFKQNNQVPYFHPAFSHWRDGRETLGFFVVFSRFLSKTLSPFAQDLQQSMALTCSMVSTAVLLDLFGSRLVGWE